MSIGYVKLRLVVYLVSNFADCNEKRTVQLTGKMTEWAEFRNELPVFVENLNTMVVLEWRSRLGNGKGSESLTDLPCWINKKSISCSPYQPRICCQDRPLPLPMDCWTFRCLVRVLQKRTSDLPPTRKRKSDDCTCPRRRLSASSWPVRPPNRVVRFQTRIRRTVGQTCRPCQTRRPDGSRSHTWRPVHRRGHTRLAASSARLPWRPCVQKRHVAFRAHATRRLHAKRFVRVAASPPASLSPRRSLWTSLNEIDVRRVAAVLGHWWTVPVCRDSCASAGSAVFDVATTPERRFRLRLPHLWNVWRGWRLDRRRRSGRRGGLMKVVGRVVVRAARVGPRSLRQEWDSSDRHLGWLKLHDKLFESVLG